MGVASFGAVRSDSRILVEDVEKRTDLRLLPGKPAGDTPGGSSCWRIFSNVFQWRPYFRQA